MKQYPTQDLSQQIFKAHIPLDSSTYYPAFYVVGLHYKTPTLKHACQAGSLLTIFMMVSGVTRPLLTHSDYTTKLLP